jgi:hypothetical protein
MCDGADAGRSVVIFLGAIERASAISSATEWAWTRLATTSASGEVATSATGSYCLIGSNVDEAFLNRPWLIASAFSAMSSV